MSFVLESTNSIEEFKKVGGGKATNMARLSQNGFLVPDWFCVGAGAFKSFLEENNFDLKVGNDFKEFSERIEKTFLSFKLSSALESEIFSQLEKMKLENRFVAVRSSGLDEDSADNSFAGQFSSYLFQKGKEAIVTSLKKCWASGFSERALSYRIERGLPLTDIGVGVVIQLMVNAETAGVAFSRDPVKATDRDHCVVSSVWGLGEGLVSGELDADYYQVHRESFKIIPTLVDKEWAFYQAPQGGLEKVKVPTDKIKISSLTDAQVKEVSQLALNLEKRLGSTQDCEWGFEGGKLYCLQTRPVTNLPGDAFFDVRINGDKAILWDNSNIIESYSGVTSPLTFSFASSAYRQVYIQFCEVMGVPKEMIASHESMYRNMLGLIRGRIYYHLINWYRLVLMLPGTGSNQGFMETMMGVKQSLKPELANLFEFTKHPPKYSRWKRTGVSLATLYRFIRIDTIIGTFQAHFKQIYDTARKTDFKKMSLPEQVDYYQYLDDQILRRWHAPIINDYLCMIFFGLIKKVTENWVAPGDAGSSLQNDLLCGQGDLESTEPTKMLMRIADLLDHGDSVRREWFIKTDPSQIWVELNAGHYPEIAKLVAEFLDKYGFRCINELKLEENDLHDDPSFALNAVASYVRMKAYSIKAMEERERAIKIKAEALVREKLYGPKRSLYFWILKQARRAVRNRENLRFARTKIFGVVRHLFRAMGDNFVKLGIFNDPRDIFYLTVDEIFAFVEGRPVTLDLQDLVKNRRAEYAAYEKSPPPPDRLLTYGAAGAAMRYAQVLSDLDLLRSEMPVSDDPNILMGTPCCPGVVEGVVRVVHDVKDAIGLNGEILVTGRTDPGWVPLYPSCSGLLIERGSLLSHSAVVARELGLPTIVGISGGLMKKLKTGQRVRVDAGKGEVRILS